jgi:hypothetical protein
LERLAKVEGNESLAIICFTSDLSKEQRIFLYKAGSLDVITMPMLKDEFKMLYEKYCNSLRNGKEKLGSVMQGKLEDFNIIDLVQSLEDGKKTAILKLKRIGDSGQIMIKDGEIYSSEYSYLKQLPPVDDILLIAPNLDMQKIPDKDLKYIKSFHGGNTIYQFLINFTLDDLKLLDIAVKFHSKKMLLTREQFDAFITEYEAEVEKGGILGSFSKMFKKNGKSKDSKSIAERRKRDKTQIINPNLDDQIRESVILVDPVELNEFKQKIEEI